MLRFIGRYLGLNNKFSYGEKDNLLLAFVYLKCPVLLSLTFRCNITTEILIPAKNKKGKIYIYFKIKCIAIDNL